VQGVTLTGIPTRAGCHINRPHRQQCFHSTCALLSCNPQARLVALARDIGCPVIAWRIPLSDKKLSPASLNYLHSTYDQLNAYFVPGAPAVIEENQNVTKRAANGSRATFHSLTLDDDDPESFAATTARLRAAQPGEIVFLDEPPSFINVRLTGPDIVASEWVGLTIVAGEAVIPVQSSGKKASSLKQLLGSTLLPCFKALTVRLPPVSPAYAVTFFKIQGFTCDALIVDLTNNCLMKLQALYVSVTRVKRGADMRTLQCKVYVASSTTPSTSPGESPWLT